MPRGGRLRRVHHQHVRNAGDERDRHEVLDRVVRHLRIERRIDRLRADRSHQQRVAVGRRLGDEVGAEVAAGAGLVLDDEGLAERLAELRREGAREDVGRPAGRERHDDADRLVRPRALRARPRRWRRARETEANERTTTKRHGRRPAPGRGRLAASVATRGGRPKEELARCAPAAGEAEQRRRSGTTGRGSLSKSPDCPLLLDAVRPAGVDPSTGARRERVGVTGSRPARRPKTFSLAASLPAGRTRTAAAARAADAPAPAGAGRLRRAARRRCRETAPLPGISGAETKAEVSMAVRLPAIRTTRRRDAGAHAAGRRRARRSAPVESRARSSRLRAPRRRAAAAAPKPRRSSDEAPPWQRGPAGRRRRGEAVANGAKSTSAAFGDFARGNISLQRLARDTGRRNDCAKPRRVIDATRRRSHGGRCRVRALTRRAAGATSRVGIASRCYEGRSSR